MILEHMFPLRESRKKNKQAFRERLQTVCPQVVLTWGRSSWETSNDVNDIANDTDKRRLKTFSLENPFHGVVCKMSVVCIYL